MHLLNNCLNNEHLKETHLQTSVNNFHNDMAISSFMLPIGDEPIPEKHGYRNSITTDISLHQLRRKTVLPLQMNRKKRAEGLLAWFHLSPKGRTGLHENCSFPPPDYCQVRIT